MGDNPNLAITPAGWLEVIAESEADVAAGRVVPGDAVMRGLRESLARLEAKTAARKPHNNTPRR